MRHSNHLYSEVLWMSLCCECVVLPCRSLCDRLIPCTEKSYECLPVLSVVCCLVDVCATG